MEKDLIQHAQHKPEKRQYLYTLIRVLLILFSIAAVFTIHECIGVFATKVPEVASIGLRPVTYNPALPITKSYFVIDTSPGVTIHNQLFVSNIGKAIGTFDLYGVDSTTGTTSGTVYRQRNEKRLDVGKWLQLGISRITLAPGQSRIIDFTVTIPRYPRSGQHVGGIVAELIPPGNTGESQQSKFGVQIKNLTIVAVQINLPGPLTEQLRATGMQAGGANGFQTVQVSLSNTGNTMLKPSGILRILDTHGSVLQNLKLHLDTFQPITAIDYPVFVQKQALGVGVYHAELMLTYGHQHQLNYQTTFTITATSLSKVFSANRTPLHLPVEDLSAPIPWLIILGGALLLLTAFFCGRLLKH